MASVTGPCLPKSGRGQRASHQCRGHRGSEGPVVIGFLPMLAPSSAAHADVHADPREACQPARPCCPGCPGGQWLGTRALRHAPSGHTDSLRTPESKTDSLAPCKWPSPTKGTGDSELDPSRTETSTKRRRKVEKGGRVNPVTQPAASGAPPRGIGRLVPLSGSKAVTFSPGERRASPRSGTSVTPRLPRAHPECHRVPPARFAPRATASRPPGFQRLLSATPSS